MGENMDEAKGRVKEAAGDLTDDDELKREGKADRMVAWWNRKVIDMPLEKVAGRSRTVDPDGSLVRTARALGICLGD